MSNETPSWPRPVLFGCRVDGVTPTQAVAWVRDRVKARQPVRVGAVNAAKLVKMEREPELARVVGNCELILADGMSVVWAARLLTGARLRRVAGIDLMDDLITDAEAQGHRVFFLGAKPEILQKMIHVLGERHPSLAVAGFHHGYFSSEEVPRIVGQIRDSRADLLFVGMGTPAKELWIDRHFMDAAVPVSMGVGGSFDVIAGLVKRAPRWMQQLGLEWFFRLVQEPRRLWRRYFHTTSIFIWEVAVRTVRRLFARRNGDA